MIVSTDADLENIERTGAYDGFYLVLGGTIPVLDKEPGKKIRIKGLMDTVATRAESGLPASRDLRRARRCARRRSRQRVATR